MTDASKIRSAIDHIKCVWGVAEWAAEIAVDAMMAKIPLKPMVRVDVYNENLCNLYCPACGAWIGMWNKRLKAIDMHNNANKNICATCGQAIMTDIERWEDKA